MLNIMKASNVAMQIRELEDKRNKLAGTIANDIKKGLDSSEWLVSVHTHYSELRLSVFKSNEEGQIEDVVSLEVAEEVTIIERGSYSDNEVDMIVKAVKNWAFSEVE